MTIDFSPATAIYTPAEVSKYGKEQIDFIRKNQHRALKFFVPGIDDYFAPMLPGQVCAVIAQTSNYKSGFLHAWERVAANQLKAEGRDEIIVHVSVEEGIEEQAYLLLGIETGDNAGELARGQVQDWSRLEEAAVKIADIDIYRIGESLARSEDFPNLYLSNMIRSIKYMRDELFKDKKKIAALFFDYLQAFPFDPEIRKSGNKEAQRRLQVRDDIYRLRQAAAYFNAPVVVAVQAKQTLAASKDTYIPGIYDGEESSAIAQRCDRVIQLWMPKMSWPVGHTLELPKRYQVTENTLWVKVGKQRGRLPSGKGFLCRIDFTKNVISKDTNF
jgi:hypothetical protein